MTDFIRQAIAVNVDEAYIGEIIILIIIRIKLEVDLSIFCIFAYSGDTRSAIPVIPVHSVADFQYRRQN